MPRKRNLKSEKELSYGRKSLFKTNPASAPDYQCFLELMRTHDNELSISLLSHYKIIPVRCALACLNNYSDCITEDLYNNIIYGEDRIIKCIINASKACSEECYLCWSTYYGYNTRPLAISDIADKLLLSNSTIRRRIDKMNSMLLIELKKQFNFETTKTARQKYEDVRITRVSKPLSEKEAILMGRYLIKRVGFTWKLPDSGTDSMDRFCTFLGSMFRDVSIKTAVGARVLLCGGSHEMAYKMRCRFRIQRPDNKPRHDYRHSKRTFINYVRGHKEEYEIRGREAIGKDV